MKKPPGQLLIDERAERFSSTDGTLPQPGESPVDI
jgi:hypothetical protein